MGGVHVRAHPQAGVGDRDTRRRDAQPAIRSSAGETSRGLEQLLDAERRRLDRPRRERASHGSTSAWSWLPARSRQLAPAERARRDPRRTAALRPSPRAAGPWRSSSTSPSSTTRSTSATRLEQRRAQLRRAQQVGARDAAEVQVGDDQRAHRWRRASIGSRRRAPRAAAGLALEAPITPCGRAARRLRGSAWAA